MNSQEMVVELIAVLRDVSEEGDLVGHLSAWLQVRDGLVTPDSIAPMPTWDRSGMALALAANRTGVTSAQLAASAHVGIETARQLLVQLAREGRLLPHGDTKGRHYTLAPDYQAGRIRGTAGTPSVPAGGKR